MEKKIKLLDNKKDITRGCVFRCKARYPYEEVVDFMVAESFYNGEPRYAVYVISGYKAGSLVVWLPNESLSTNYGLSWRWVIENWDKWIYLDCDIENVWIVEKSVPTLD